MNNNHVLEREEQPLLERIGDAPNFTVLFGRRHQSDNERKSYGPVKPKARPQLSPIELHGLGPEIRADRRGKPRYSPRASSSRARTLGRRTPIRTESRQLLTVDRVISLNNAVGVMRGAGARADDSHNWLYLLADLPVNREFQDPPPSKINTAQGDLK